MLPSVWLSPGTLTVYGAALDASAHKHHAIQLVWPAGDFVIHSQGETFTGPVMINSQVEHRMQMAAGWVILVEPQSDFGQQLADYLQHRSLMAIDIAGFNGAVPEQGDSLAPLLAPLLSAIGLDKHYAHSNGTTMLSDQRIQQLLAELDRCLLSRCLKPSGWRAADVSRQLGLSESRFLHLFREQVGIAWRPYLLWRRTICAINGMLRGEQATTAAHAAGFSDSAHLSRTFRTLFGMSIRAVKQPSKPG
ncbi:AraC family transcriptional regulator [Aestuariirhabdus sp. Z084]|uniref:helix-turn-helix transcriptional regulator n=1 Tax=Aestuariirhabdus haliotis TaxID=2918751 RepID=UPI00201B3F0F|nr:AraC family transcriptional regulator [Aestuariirhabdus haliotis]MCL6417613.1 AraC family transcriptional regulator [Aestuariirhabdus haliotis]MCL6421539.1 AraC family transcriptional regulator [Aestuariirhabdus haliotis]